MLRIVLLVKEGGISKFFEKTCGDLWSLELDSTLEPLAKLKV